MRGADQLIAMRRRGKVPPIVFLDAERARLPMADDWSVCTPTQAHLQLDADERPHRVDMRCVIGLLVLISGDEAERVHALRDACIAAGARRVIASVITPIDDLDIDGNPVLITREITDTEGHLGFAHP